LGRGEDDLLKENEVRKKLKPPVLKKECGESEEKRAIPGRIKSEKERKGRLDLPTPPIRGGKEALAIRLRDFLRRGKRGGRSRQKKEEEERIAGLQPKKGGGKPVSKLCYEEEERLSEKGGSFFLFVLGAPGRKALRIGGGASLWGRARP